MPHSPTVTGVELGAAVQTSAPLGVPDTSFAQGAVHVVVTGVKSRTHLVYVASYVRTLLEGAEAVKVSLVEAPAFLSAPTIGVDDARALLPRDPRLTVEQGMPGWRFDDGARAVYVAVGAPGLKASLALRRADPLRRIECVVTDEGIGTYGSFASRREAITRQGVSTMRAALRAGLVQTSARLLTTRRWAAYERLDGSADASHGWRVNPHVAEEFTRDLDGAEPGTSRDAVILTQPFVDLGLIDESAYVDYVTTLARAAANAGLRPVVRPHPAERHGRYDALTVTADGSWLAGTGTGPAELDRAVVSAAVVLGGPSTAMVNLAAMTGMPVVWASEPSLAYLDHEVSHDQRAIFETFLGRPHDPADVERALTSVVERP